MNPRPRAPLADRFWPKVDRRGPGECWPWLAATNALGYGRINAGGRGATIKAHRAAYELLVGPIPSGLELDHLCRQPSCVNPAHLEPVTHAVNMARAWKATRTHCKNGHLLAGPNLRITVQGGRHCRPCQREYERVRWPITKRARAAARERTRLAVAA